MKNSKFQLGNAITEFAVLAAVMVPAALAIPTLGKLADVNQTTVQASRYVAWERTVSDGQQKPDLQLSVEVKNRFFSDNDIFIQSEQEELSGSENANAFWTSGVDEYGEAIAMIAQSEGAITVRSRNERIPSDTGAHILSEGISLVGSVMEGFIPDAEWDLEERGFYVAEVGVELSQNSVLTGSHDCTGQSVEGTTSCLQKVNAIFVDGWESASPRQTEERVKALVPAGALAPVADMLAYVGYVPLFKELRYLDGAFGRVEVDILPEDRHGDE